MAEESGFFGDAATDIRYYTQIAMPLIKFRAVGGGYPAGCTAVLNIAGSYGDLL